ncbi:ABC transporter ATP-binding protein [Bacillus sp. Xin]|uniref:ABC transporter ATP-binding protein n=1 Tax=unclassified Bacillus (in: firmicutes) TaxID=185979 RepID=UPI00157249E1|nr:MULTISPECIES: ABC transporter ATP-binding protein [unclassified Bacillus (in: firmicutes)]MBC6973541.1 ABC transporter ATP-binding protein [Bacillus sp. Xin]NSW39498.1 ABC transporter ATP-binding protein [Bacillus sp. Xin1]HEK9103801.1 ABC transporter ATP-binding protein [Bacillus pseudomycoides]
MLKFYIFLKKVPKYLSLILYSLKLFWKCDSSKSVILLFITLINALLGPLLVWLSAKVIDGITESPFDFSSWNSVVWISLIYIGLTLVVDALQPISEMQKRLLTAKLEAHIDELLIKKVNAMLGISIFEQSSFHTNSQIIKYNEYFVTMWINIISQTFSGLVMIIASSFLIGKFAFWIPIIFLLLALPKMFWEAKLNNATFEGRPEVQELRRRAEYYSGVPLSPSTANEVKVYSLVPLFKSLYRSTSTQLLHTISKDQKRLALYQLFWSVLQSITVGIIVIYIVKQAIKGEVTVGDLLLFIGAVVQFNEGVNEMFAAFAIGARETRHLNNIFTFLNSAVDMQDGAHTLSNEKRDGYRLENVSFTYNGSKEIINIHNLSIPLHKTTVLVGENGSGKTTLLKLLLRYFDLNQGEIYYNGLPLKDYKTNSFRTNTTAVFQDFLRYEMTLRDNISIGNISFNNNLDLIEKASQLGGVDHFLSKLDKGYDTELGRLFGGRNLSGGEWQRIAISRAFMRNKTASLLVFDEPSSALDAFIEEEIFDKLNKLKEGKTVIIVSHRLSTARFADNVIFLEQGQVLETGTHDELIAKKGKYAELYELQARKYL